MRFAVSTISIAPLVAVACLGLASCEQPTPEPVEEPAEPDAGQQSENVVADSVAELTARVQAEGEAMHTSLTFEDGTLVAGPVEKGLLTRFKEGDEMPQAQYIVDCHDPKTGDILSSTEANTNAEVTAALNACTAAGNNAEWCSATPAE